MGGDLGQLDGVRVVEIANYMAGPFAGMMLADLGADVIKVEPPTGDPFRRFGRPSTAMSAVFANCNRGKRSVVLDLKVSDDRDALVRLLATADVLLCNWRPAVGERLGLGDAMLERANPLLVRVYVTGFGPTGPLVDAPAFDTVVQALTGMTYAMSPTNDPMLVPGYPVDKLSSVMAVQATLAALVGRARRGHGERVDVPMLDAAAYLNFVDLLPNRTYLDHQPDDPRNLHGLALRPVAAADGWLVIAPVSSAAIRGACAAVDHPEWGDEVLAERDQVAMIGLLFDRLESVTKTRLLDDVLRAFAAHDVAASACLGIDEHFADPQIVHNAIYTVTSREGFGRVRSVRYPAQFSAGGGSSSLRDAPLLGEHTAEVLGAL